MFNHVMLGTNDIARAERFYGALLGLPRRGGPPVLAARGGCWFRGGGVELHLGVETPFAPARKAHPALLWPALDALAARLEAAAAPVASSSTIPMAGANMRARMLPAASSIHA